MATGAKGRQHALLFIDLDQFKKVNDTLGHPFGDSLLCEASKRLQALFDSNSIVARFGGDEFVVLKPCRATRSKSPSLPIG